MLVSFAPLAQLVEQLTLNQWVQGSSPWWCTMLLARWSSGQDAGLSRRKQGFDSPTGHQLSTVINKNQCKRYLGFFLASCG